MSRLPLTGVRVLDFTWVVAGPTTTKWLAAYGAEVIKVESNRGATDMVRTDGGATAKGKAGPNVSGSFSNMNTDKLAIALNMNHEKGKAIARRLVEVSDVVIENFTPRVMPGWGFAYEDLKMINPGVITVSMPGLGSTGPHAHYRGLGSFFMVRTGLDDLVGYPHRPTVDMGFAFPDASVNPVHTAVSILAALHHRQRTGEGQRVELRQFESTVNYLNTALLDYSVNGRVAQRTGSRHPNGAPHGVYRCAPSSAHAEPRVYPELAEREAWCAITVFTEEEWLALCKATGHADWANDPRFGTLAARKKHEDELDTCINAWTETLPAEEVMNLLQLHGVAAGVVQHAGDLIEADPQMNARGFYHNLHHDEIGDMTVEGIPFKLRSTPGVPKRPAPLLGEHNDFVLQEVLGMTEQEVNDCIVDGAVM